MSTKGQSLRGDGHGFLNKCRCPIDTALTEFWMYKITSGNPDVPQRTEEAFSTSDFALNPVSLRVVRAAIEAASGLNPDTMFQSTHDRLKTTILWALDNLIEDYDPGVQSAKIKKVKSYFEKVMEGAAVSRNDG
jgi:hypothetical protein